MTLRNPMLRATGLATCVLALWALTQPTYGQVNDSARGRVTVRAQSPSERRAWTSRVDSMLRSGELRLRQTKDDTLLPGRTHERADQYYRGVRVFGADVARQLRNGVTESLFGTIYEGIDIDPNPTIDDAGARDALAQGFGVFLGR